MNSAKAIIGKNLVLIALVILTISTLFRGTVSKAELLIFQIILGLLYAILSYVEYNNTSYKAQLPVERFAYYPGSFFTLRALKVGIYASFGLLLFASPSAVKIIYPVCFIIAFTELVISLLKFNKKLCFVNVYANYILIALENMEKIFANEIDYIEYRHEIFYIIKKNGRSSTIKTFSIDNKELFMTKMLEWIRNNKITVSEESKQKLGL